ncbi:MAG: TetR/AcrR family transcriptional regulator [Myxococcales bacterium]|nr:TetR/AcrR family transcriptional regulator [Myxococcales bacterium]
MAQRDTKAAILEAAGRHFARKGYHATAIRDIAADAAIDVKTLYYHWSSKQTLFEAVVAARQAKLERQLDSFMTRTRGMNLGRSIEVMIDTLIPALVADPDTSRIMLFSMADFAVEDADWDVRYMPLFISTIRRFVLERTGRRTLPRDFDLTMLGLINMLVIFCGTRVYQARVLGIDADSQAYVDAMKRMAKAALAPQIDLLAELSD